MELSPSAIRFAAIVVFIAAVFEVMLCIFGFVDLGATEPDVVAQWYLENSGAGTEAAPDPQLSDILLPILAGAAGVTGLAAGLIGLTSIHDETRVRLLFGLSIFSCVCFAVNCVYNIYISFFSALDWIDLCISIIGVVFLAAMIKLTWSSVRRTSQSA